MCYYGTRCYFVHNLKDAHHYNRKVYAACVRAATAAGEPMPKSPPPLVWQNPSERASSPKSMHSLYVDESAERFPELGMVLPRTPDMFTASGLDLPQSSLNSMHSFYVEEHAERFSEMGMVLPGTPNMFNVSGMDFPQSSPGPHWHHCPPDGTNTPFDNSRLEAFKYLSM